MSISVSQKSFTGGEWSESLYARSDLAKYSTATRITKNAYPHPHGGVSNRGGYEFLGESKYSSLKSKLIPFQFSVEQAYMLEFGEGYIRFNKDKSRVVEDDKVISGATQADPVVITAASHGYEDGDWVIISEVVGMTELNDKTYIAANKTTNTFELTDIVGDDIDGTGFNAYVSDGVCNKIYEISGLEDDKVISGATQADPVVITATAHGYVDGDWIEISGVVGMTELNGNNYVVSNKTTNTFELTDTDGEDIDGTGFTAYVSDGVCNRIPIPYLENDLALLKYTQSADVLFLTHPKYASRKLSRTSHTSWTIETTDFSPSISAPTGFSRASGSGTGHTYAVTAVKVNGEESIPSSTASGGHDDQFQWNAVTDADHYVFYEVKNEVYGFLGTANSLTYDVESTITPDMEDTAPIARNPFKGAGNYPGVSCFFQQRWVAARTDNFPQTVFGSRTGTFDNMNSSVPLKDDDSYTFPLATRQVNEVRWLVPMGALLIGTSGREFKMTSGSNSDSITPLSVDIKPQSNWGSSNIQPIVIGSSVIFVDISGGLIRDLTFSLEIDGYAGNDLSILSNHLFRGYDVIEWAYQKHPDSIIWCVRDDGVLLGLTYYKEHQVWGWHRHITQGYYESIASITNASGSSDVYIVVRRLINGVYKRYIETMKDRLPTNDLGEFDIQDAFFVDSGLSYDVPVTISGASQASPVVITAAAHGFEDGDIVDITEVAGMAELNGFRFKSANKTVNTFELTDEEGNDIDGTGYTAYVSGGTVRKTVTSISGLEHLEGMNVAVLANGNVIPGRTVTNGNLTPSLSTQASRVHVGLGYNSDIETMDFEYQTETGTVQDKTRDIDSVLLELENTRGLWVGPSDDRLLEIAFRDQEHYGEPTELYNGDKEIYIEESEGRTGRVFLRNIDPVPFTVLGLTARITHGER